LISMIEQAVLDHRMTHRRRALVVRRRALASSLRRSRRLSSLPHVLRHMRFEPFDHQLQLRQPVRSGRNLDALQDL